MKIVPLPEASAPKRSSEKSTPLIRNCGSIPIVCACDNNYAMQLAVMVASMAKHLSRQHTIQLYVIDGGIAPSNKEKISKTLGNRGSVEYLQPKPAHLKGLKVSGHVSIAAYYRFLIPELLKDLEKVIYLDCDLVVNSDISKLWDQDVSQCCVKAVQEFKLSHISTGILNYKEMNLPGDAMYFNSGVLLINLKSWRVLNISQKACEYIRCYRQYVRFWDQDGLNVALSGHWEPLDPLWNRTAHVHDYTSWRDSPFDESTYERLIEEPHIVHFTTRFKPWNSYNHPDKKLFYQYVDISAWRGWRYPLWKAIWQRGMEKIWSGVNQWRYR